jgi:GMP synthase (glutamine-hydrolysing)
VRWFVEGLGLAPDGVRVADVPAGEPLPAPQSLGGVVVTGSPAMVSDADDWSLRTADWLPGVVQDGVPLLGVCYGHQLLAQALGGRAGPNPLGLEMGTVQATLTGEAAGDPLFEGMPRDLPLQVTHQEAVLELPPGARLLATTARDPHHAFAVGQQTWGVQFHPEFDADIVRGYIRLREQQIRSRGQDPAALLEGVQDAPHGPALLRRFARLVASGER